MTVMVRRTAMVFLLIVLGGWGGSVAFGAAGSGNLVRNPGFEEKGQGWKYAFWSSKGTKGAGAWTADAHSGNLAVEIVGITAAEEKDGKSGEHPRGLFISQPISCEAGRYELGFWYRSKGDEVVPHIEVADSESGTFLLRQSMERSSTWRYAKFDLYLTGGEITLRLRGSNIGSVSYDDISLTKLSAPIQSFLFPGRRAYGDERVYLIDRNVSPIALGLAGDLKQLSFPVSLEITVPSGMKLYANWAMREDGTDGGARRYVIEISEQEIKQRLFFGENLKGNSWVTLWAEVNGSIPEEATLAWRLRMGTNEYPENTAKVFVLPPLPERQDVKNFDLMFQWSLYQDVPKELWERVYQLYRTCGINTLLWGGDRPEPTQYYGWGGWVNYCIKRFSEDHGKIILNASPGWLHGFKWVSDDTLFDLANGGSDTFRKLDQGYSASRSDEVDGFLWDAEFFVGGAYLLNTVRPFGPKTRAAFAEYKGLNPAQVTEEAAKTTYWDDYEDFCINQLGGKILKGWAAYLRELKPDALLIAQQGPGADGRNIDMAYYDVDYIGRHSPMVYTSSPAPWADMIEQTCDYVLQPLMPAIGSGLHRDYIATFATRSYQSFALDILSAASLGCDGVINYPDLHRFGDANLIWHYAQAFRNIKAVEELLESGNRIDQKVTIEGLPETETEITVRGKLFKYRYPEWDKALRYRAFQIHKDRLITVFNYHADKTAYVRISAQIGWPRENFKVYDAVSGTRLVLAPDRAVWNAEELKAGVLVSIPPTSAAFLRITQDENGLPKKTVCVAETLSAFERIKAEANGDGRQQDMGEMTEENLKISWDDLDHDGGLEAVLVTSMQKVWITPSGGRVLGWTPTGQERNLAKGGAGVDKFWLPTQVQGKSEADTTYRVTQRRIKDGVASVTVENEVSNADITGLRIEKTYSVDAQSTDIRVEVKMTSTSIDPEIEFSYWTQSSFALGDSDKLVYESPKGMFIQGDEVLHSSFGLRAGLSDDLSALGSKPTLDPISGNWLATWDPKARDAVTVGMDYDHLLQIYKWSGKSVYTLEWMYQPVKLSPNQSWTTTFKLGYCTDKQW